MIVQGKAMGKVMVSVLAAGLLAGCANVPRGAGFSDVRASVSERTGGKRVVWNQGTQADAAITAEIRSLLANELNSDQAVQIALLNNRNLQATYEDLMVAQADLVAAGLLSNPIFNSDLRFFDEGVSAEMSVTQNFLELLYIPLRKKVAEARFEAVKLRVAGAVLDLAGEVRSAFYELQAAQQNREMRQQVQAATEASYNLAKRMRKAGNSTALDLVNERSLYEQSRVNLAAAEAQVLQERERLNELLGLWGDQTQWQVAGRLPEPSSEALAGEGMERTAIARSVDLGALRNDTTAAARTLGIARPFSGFSFLDAGVSAEGDPGGEWALGPALSLPIPLFNQGQPAIASAQAEYRRAAQLYAALAVTIRARVRAARDAVISAKDRAEHYRRVILPVRGQVVDQTQLQYNAMQVSPFQLLLAKQQQIDAASEYIDTLEEYWLAKAELDQLLNGRLARVKRREPGRARSSVQIPGAAMNTGMNGTMSGQQ